MRILLADDHAIVREGLRRIISDAYPGVEIGEAASLEEVRTKALGGRWSLLILDISLNDRSSLELVPELLRQQPGLPIVVLSMYSERPFVLRALRAGVSAYVTKDRAPEELLRAVRSVLSGRRYLCESVAAQLAEHLALVPEGGGAPHEALSAREYEVLLRIAGAQSVSEIATQLELSVKTISTYRTRILEKLGLSSNAQLMRYAIEHKLVK